MVFEPYVFAQSGEKLQTQILPMSVEDAKATRIAAHWQTDWTSDYLAQERFEKYALKTPEGETIALAAYEVQKTSIAVHIAYMESQPESNPTITLQKDARKYHGIGKVLIAYGIKLSIDNDLRGDVTLDAKTPELAQHYEQVFGALPLPRYDGTAPRYLICDEAALSIFMDYLSE